MPSLFLEMSEYNSVLMDKVSFMGGEIRLDNIENGEKGT